MEKVNVLSVMFSNMTLNETTNYVSKVMDEKRAEPFHIITANPEIVMQMNRDETFKEIEKKSGLITADGIGIIYGAKILGRKIDERVTGVELLVELLKLCDRKHHSIYLLGADEETNKELYEHVQLTYPNIKITGRHNGYFDVNNDGEIVKDINDKKPDFLIMAMGSPRSHKWFDGRRLELQTKLTMDVGGGFDALTGKVKRAPMIVQKLNLEWVYRRLQNPSRAERQKDLYRFAGEVIKERFRSNKKYS